MEIRGGNVPADVSLTAAGLEIHVLSRPFHQAAGGGDVHYVSSCGTGRITRLMLADVSGHGVDVGDVARVLHDLMRRHVNHIDQRKFAEQMNAEFTRLTESGRFATAIIATYFAPMARLTLINAGHPPPLLYRAAAQQWSLLDDNSAAHRSNFPLGVVDLTQYAETEIDLQPGDAVLCYTDALPESRDESGELIGYAKLLELAGPLAQDAPLADWLGDWTGRIDAITPGDVADDDLTVLLIRATAGATRAPLVPRLIGMSKTLVRPSTWPELTVRNVGGSILPWLSGKPAR